MDKESLEINTEKWFKRTLFTLRIINTNYNSIIDTNFLLSHIYPLYLNLTLEIVNTNYITNSHLSANLFAENYSAKKRIEIPANKIVQS